MGNIYSVVFGVFFLVPVASVIANFFLNNFYPFKRFSDIAEVEFVKHALKNYVIAKKLKVTKEYDFNDYPRRDKKYCGLRYREANPIFSHYLNYSSNRYFGIGGVISSDGIFCGYKLLEPGHLEDFLYYITNHDAVLGMFFADIECNPTHSWRFGFLWFTENAFPFFLYSLLNLILNGATVDDNFSLYFTFVFIPIKYVIKSSFRCLMSARQVVDDDKEHRRRCLKCVLCCKDMCFGLIMMQWSCGFYALAALMASVTLNSGVSTRYFVGYFILSTTFYEILFLFAKEFLWRGVVGRWGDKKYYITTLTTTPVLTAENEHEQDLEKGATVSENVSMDDSSIVMNMLHTTEQHEVVKNTDIIVETIVDDEPSVVVIAGTTSV